MRTTFTIDPDVEQRIRRRMAREKLPFKQVVNDALRAGLSSTREESAPDFVVKPHSFGFKPGIDLGKMNQLADELEAEEVARKLRRENLDYSRR
jgi:hypothetical protein